MLPSENPSRRARLTRDLFERIARGYDRMNVLLSLGRDKAWKRLLVEGLPTHKAPRILDLATGTGDLAFLLLRRFPKARLTALDVSPAMLNLAKRRELAEAPGKQVRWMLKDMCKPYGSPGNFDLITGGYALRNAANLEAALAQLARALRPGGHAVFLEFSKPDGWLPRALVLSFLWLWGGFWGILVHRDRSVYQYFAHSLSRFPEHRQLLARFQAHGLSCVGDRRLYLGMLRILSFQKAGRPGQPSARARG